MTAALAAILCCVGCSEQPEQAAGQVNPPMSIEPGVAVGSIRAGMPVQEVIARLGKPERQTANALEYTRRGFAVMPNSEGLVQVVMCGDVTGLGGPLVKAFNGRTKEGIGLTSSRQDVVKAYGEPDVDEKLRGGTESMRYNSLGITFTLEAGKVYHMIVRLSAPAAPDRTISIEPVPDTTQR